MRKFVLISIVGIIVFVLVAFQFSQHSVDARHEAISAEHVENIELYGLKEGFKQIEERQQIEKMIKWFNAAEYLRENTNVEEMDTQAGIILHFKSGDKIFILHSKNDFKIQRYNQEHEKVTYWARQPQLESLLKNLAGH